MTLSTKDLTWTCHVCGTARPDSKISVHKKPVPGSRSIVQNIRYCNDNPECSRDSKAVSFLEKWT